MGSLWRGVVHMGGFVTGDSQTLLVTSTPLATGQAFNGVRSSEGVSVRRGWGRGYRKRNNKVNISEKVFVPLYLVLYLLSVPQQLYFYSLK